MKKYLVSLSILFAVLIPSAAFFPHVAEAQYDNAMGSFMMINTLEVVSAHCGMAVFWHSMYGYLFVSYTPVLEDCSPPAVTCESTDTCTIACTVSNACSTASGTKVGSGGACNATPAALPNGYGNSCWTAENWCGQVNYGTVQCNGSCSVTTPPANPTDYCPAMSGYQCPGTTCVNDSTTCYSAENWCGSANQGTLTNGVCSATTPANPTDYCPTMSGYQCPGTTCVNDPVYSESTYAPTSCGTPSATLTAAPTRVRSGQTSTLTLSATGVTTSCTVTGPGVNTTVPASSCGVSRTIVTPAITSQVTYKVTCDSTVDIAKIIVNLVPKVIEF